MFLVLSLIIPGAFVAGSIGAVTASAADNLAPTWVVSGAVIALPFVRNTFGAPPYNAVQINSVTPQHFEGILTAGNLDRDGFFVPVESGVTFKFTAIGADRAIFFMAEKRSVYVDEKLNTYIMPPNERDLRRVGEATATLPEENIFLRAVEAPFDRFTRVDTGPLGQAVVHGYFLKLARPLTIAGEEYSVLRFSDYTGYSKGELEFGNLDSEGRWQPSGITTEWRYDRLGVTFGGRSGIPLFEIRNQTSKILKPNIDVSVLSMLDRSRRYRLPEFKPVLMLQCMQLFAGQP